MVDRSSAIEPILRLSLIQPNTSEEILGGLEWGGGVFGEWECGLIDKEMGVLCGGARRAEWLGPQASTGGGGVFD